MKNYGRGKLIWSSASIESFALQSLSHRSVFINIVKSLAQEKFSFEADAPSTVEVTLFHKPQEKRYLINIINFQSEIGVPNIPVDDIVARVKVGEEPLRATLLPDQIPLKFTQKEGYINVSIPRVETFHMVALDYE